MSRSNIYPFDNIANYNISDSNKIEVIIDGYIKAVQQNAKLQNKASKSLIVW